MSMVETVLVIMEVMLEAKVVHAFAGEGLSERCAAHSAVREMVTLNAWSKLSSE